MSYTKSTLRTAVLRKADAVVGVTVSPAFDSTIGGEVDRTIGMVFDREWRRILNVNRYTRMQKVTTPTDATGRIALTALSTGATDAIKRFYRVITVSSAGVPFSKAEFADMPLGEDVGRASYEWYQEGTNLMFLPKTLSTNFDITVNYIPQRVDKLSGEAIAVDFPEEYEELIVFEAAAWLLAKGGNETRAASELRAAAEDIRDDMLQDLARLSTNPDKLRYPDSPSSWGG